MIIFNQQEFDNRDMFREGSDEDVKSLQRTFANFGIKPAERKDFKLKQIQQEVKICKYSFLLAFSIKSTQLNLDSIFSSFFSLFFHISHIS